MGPEKRKGEVPSREAARRDAPRDRGGAGSEAADPREESGYSQPESSAQKAPEAPPDAPRHPKGARGDPSE